MKTLNTGNHTGRQVTRANVSFTLGGNPKEYRAIVEMINDETEHDVIKHHTNKHVVITKTNKGS